MTDTPTAACDGGAPLFGEQFYPAVPVGGQGLV